MIYSEVATLVSYLEAYSLNKLASRVGLLSIVDRKRTMGTACVLEESTVSVE